MIVRRRDFSGFGLTAEQMKAAIVGRKLTPATSLTKSRADPATVAASVETEREVAHGSDPYANSGLPGSGGYDASTGEDYYSPPAEEGMGTGVKVAIGLGIAVVILGGAYAASSRR